MGSLPRKARVYLVSMYVLGTGVALMARWMSLPRLSAPGWELGLFITLGALAGGRKIRLMRSKGDDDVGSMSLGFAIAFAAMLRFGPAGGLVVNTACCLSGCLYPKRQALYQLLFNVALTAVESWTAGLVFLLLNHGELQLDPVGSFPAIMASCFVYFVVNTGGVAGIIALCSNQTPLHVWRESFLWTAPSYLSGACASALALLLFDRYVGTILLFVSPAGYLTYKFYDVYTARAEEKQQHIEELQHSQEHLADLYLATIKSLALAIDAKDQYTHQHILRVQRYAVATAEYMGLSGGDLEGIRTGALLHDIGKLGVPEYVLLKPGRLTEEEFAKVKKHPEIGAAILDPVDFPWPVLPVVKYHHEKWDGTGYPDGLKGEDIPLLARILAVADVYDALTSTRSYRNAWTHERAIDLIKQESGSHFEPRIVEAFLKVIDRVVMEMAQEGAGPLVIQASSSVKATSKADQAARDIQRASSELWALYEVAQTLSSSLGLQETLDILGRKLEAILPGTACLFLLLEEDEKTLRAREAIGLNREFFAGSTTLGVGSVSMRVLQDEQTYLGEYDPDDLMLASSTSSLWTPIQTALIVPIVHQGKKLGTINIYHPQADAFFEHDVQLLEMIGERAAMALYNGLLFDRTRSHAFTDPLTGLHNVRYLTEYVEERCHGAATAAARRGALEVDLHERSDEALRASDPFALLCLDLDSFKPINDNFGHQKGDEVLRDLAGIFSSLARGEDVVARYGGDEFLIVLNGAGPDEATAMSDRLQHAVESYDPELIHPRLGALRLGVSIGFACYPADGRDCGTLLSAADARMYGDKTERKLGTLIERAAPRPELQIAETDESEAARVLPPEAGRKAA